jgi:hypothetical protein
MGSPAAAIGWLQEKISTYSKGTDGRRKAVIFDTTALNGITVIDAGHGNISCLFPVTTQVCSLGGYLHGGCIGVASFPLHLEIGHLCSMRSPWAAKTISYLLCTGVAKIGAHYADASRSNRNFSHVHLLSCRDPGRCCWHSRSCHIVRESGCFSSDQSGVFQPCKRKHRRGGTCRGTICFLIMYADFLCTLLVAPLRTVLRWHLDVTEHSEPSRKPAG